MVGMRIFAIVPKGPVTNPNALGEVTAALRNWSGATQRTMMTYPPWQPWKTRPPKTGPRAGGRRTGSLGRNWRVAYQYGQAEVYNQIPYSGYVTGFTSGVKGERQVWWQKARGWPQLNTVAKANQKRLKQDIRRALRGRRSRR